MLPAYFVAFSGHRPSQSPGRTEDDLEACRPQIRHLFQAIQARVESVEGQTHLVSSLAAGSDIIACEEAQKLGIPLHIILPNPEEEFLKSYLDEDPDRNFERWLPRAQKILATVNPNPEFPDVPIHPEHTIRVGAISSNSPDCYAEVNTKLIESADLLFTLSNGDESESIAGTTHLAKQAAAIGIPRLNLDPRHPNRAVDIPDSFASIDCASLHPFHQNSPHVTCDLQTESSPFQALTECLESAAGKSARWFRRGSALAISFHALATVLAAIVASYYYLLKKTEGSYTLFAVIAAIELILVFLGWWLERRVHRDKAQQTWLHCRFARELMRSIEQAHIFLDPLFPDIGRHQPEWRRFATTIGLQLRTEQPVSQSLSSEELEQYRERYIDGRVRDQERFFRKSAEESRPLATLFRKVTHYSGFLALLFVFLAAGIKISDAIQHDSTQVFGNDWFTYTLLLLLPILLPLVASLGSSFGAVFDYERRAARYHEISSNLERLATWLPQLSTRNDIAKAVQNTEEILLSELIEWYSAQKKGMGH